MKRCKSICCQNRCACRCFRKWQRMDVTHGGALQAAPQEDLPCSLRARLVRVPSCSARGFWRSRRGVAAVATAASLLVLCACCAALKLCSSLRRAADVVVSRPAAQRALAQAAATSALSTEAYSSFMAHEDGGGERAPGSPNARVKVVSSPKHGSALLEGPRSPDQQRPQQQTPQQPPLMLHGKLALDQSSGSGSYQSSSTSEVLSAMRSRLETVSLATAAKADLTSRLEQLQSALHCTAVLEEEQAPTATAGHLQAQQRASTAVSLAALPPFLPAPSTISATPQKRSQSRRLHATPQRTRTPARPQSCTASHASHSSIDLKPHPTPEQQRTAHSRAASRNSLLDAALDMAAAPGPRPRSASRNAAQLTAGASTQAAVQNPAFSPHAIDSPNTLFRTTPQPFSGARPAVLPRAAPPHIASACKAAQDVHSQPASPLHGSREPSLLSTANSAYLPGMPQSPHYGVAHAPLDPQSPLHAAHSPQHAWRQQQQHAISPHAGQAMPLRHVPTLASAQGQFAGLEVKELSRAHSGQRTPSSAASMAHSPGRAMWSQHSPSHAVSARPSPTQQRTSVVGSGWAQSAARSPKPPHGSASPSPPSRRSAAATPQRQARTTSASPPPSTAARARRSPAASLTAGLPGAAARLQAAQQSVRPRAADSAKQAAGRGGAKKAGPSSVKQPSQAAAPRVRSAAGGTPGAGRGGGRHSTRTQRQPAASTPAAWHD
jgi:hypothetical protein